MLVLTRKQGEEIVINDDIVITLVSCGNGRARVAVKAPQHIAVDRGEIHERKTQLLDIDLAPNASVGSIGRTFARLLAKPESRERQAALPLKSR